MSEAKGMTKTMDYSDYFEVQHHPEEISMDEFIAEAMRTDISIDNSQ